MKKSGMFLLIFLSIGCQTNQLIKKIDALVSNRDDVQRGIRLGESFDPTELIFDRLEGRISNRFVFVFSWRNHLPIMGTKDFEAIIFDRANDSTFYVSNSDNNPHVITIETIYDRDSFLQTNFVLRKYLENKIEDIKGFQNRMVSAEAMTTIYVIDTDANRVSVFRQFSMFGNDILK